MPSRQSILRLTQFPPDPNGHGACRRTLQLQEMCEEAGFDVVDISLSPAPVSRLARYLRSSRWYGLGKRPISHLHYGPGLVGAYDYALRQAFSQFEGARVVIWERTFDRLLPAIAREYSYRVIALPHNLETLCLPKSDAIQGVAPEFNDEVARLGEADACFTIAREEQWLLANFGVPSTYLPYFPPTEVAVPLRRIRAARSLVPPSGQVLVLGNALHPPTAEGMTVAIRELKATLPKGSRIVVAGFGSEALRELTNSPAIEIRGWSSPTALEALLIETSVFMANQTRGAGALTRIPEALLAGIPVLANAVAARSAQDLPGVYVYQTTAELESLLRNGLPTPPEPMRPASATTRFQTVLCEFAAKP